MMISRTAENCFWLSRNIERVQMLTNAIDVAYSMVIVQNQMPEKYKSF